MKHKNSSTNSINIINYAIFITSAFFSRFRLDKPKSQTETIQVYWWGFYMQKYMKSIMDSAYVLWTYKIHCFITPTNHIARNLICFYIYHIREHTYNIIEKNPYQFYIEVTGSYHESQ